MPCLSVEITLLPRFLSSGITIIRTPHSPIIHITRKGGVDVSVDRATKGLKLSTYDIFENNHLKASCGIVCDVSNIHYLHVSPQEVQWITPDEAIIYMVESNINWTIVTS